MGIKVVFILAVVFASQVMVKGANSNDKTIKCLEKKFTQSLGNFASCYQSAKGLPIPRIKQCYGVLMESAGVVMKASNGQMTVSPDKFEQYAEQNNNNPVGQAMKACQKSKKANDEMYKEAARASQCVFEKLKNTCK